MFLTKAVALITFLYGVCLFHLALVKHRLECYGGGSMLVLIPALETMACVHCAKPKKTHEESLVLLLFCIDLAVAALLSEWLYMKLIATALFMGIQVVGAIIFLDWLKQKRAAGSTTTCKVLTRALETSSLNVCLASALFWGFSFVYMAVLGDYDAPGLAFALFAAAAMSVVVNCGMALRRDEKHSLIVWLAFHKVYFCLAYSVAPLYRPILDRSAWVFFGCWYYVFISIVYRLYYEKRYGKTIVVVKRPIRREEPNIDLESGGRLLQANGDAAPPQTMQSIKQPSLASPSAPPLNAVE